MHKGENFSTEILELIYDSFNEDKRLIMDILHYLYHTTEDDLMKQKIVNIFNDEQYCVTCGSKLELYEWDEVHTELEHDNIEHCKCWLCPNCDYYEIEDIKGEKF